MATSPPDTSSPQTPVTYTTRRGLATASFALGLWGLLVFWWYPFGMAIAAVGLVLGLISLAMRVRVPSGGGRGEPLEVAGVATSVLAITVALLVYRFVQVAFEGNITHPFWPY
jgi:hypothetical protein